MNKMEADRSEMNHLKPRPPPPSLSPAMQVTELESEFSLLSPPPGFLLPHLSASEL